MDLHDQNYYTRNHIFMNLKIFSDNMDEPNLENAVKNSDIDPLKDILHKISYKAEKYKHLQNDDLIAEDDFAITTLEKVHVFYAFVIVQAILALFLGIYQIFRFKNALSSLF